MSTSDSNDLLDYPDLQERQHRLAHQLAGNIDRLARRLAPEIVSQAEVLAAALLQAQHPDWSEEMIWHAIVARRPFVLARLTGSGSGESSG